MPLAVRSCVYPGRKSYTETSPQEIGRIGTKFDIPMSAVAGLSVTCFTWYPAQISVENYPWSASRHDSNRNNSLFRRRQSAGH